MDELKKYIRDIPDFPKEGIMFHDITPLLQDGNAFSMAIDAMAEDIKDKDVNCLVGVEARGFIFAAALAYKLGIGLGIVRKLGKLPLSLLCPQAQHPRYWDKHLGCLCGYSDDG